MALFVDKLQYCLLAPPEAAVILWKKEDSSDMFMEESEKENKEHWTIWKMLRGHLEDVYDLCWSPCSQFLLTGAVDNTAIVWDVAKGRVLSAFFFYFVLLIFIYSSKLSFILIVVSPSTS